MTNNLIRCKICNCYTPREELCDVEGACTECCTCTYFAHDYPEDEGDEE